MQFLYNSGAPNCAQLCDHFDFPTLQTFELVHLLIYFREKESAVPGFFQQQQQQQNNAYYAQNRASATSFGSSASQEFGRILFVYFSVLLAHWR
jgi:hypothetical protein